MLITDVPIDEIRNYYINKFYSKADLAHDIEHIKTVEQRMLASNNSTPIGEYLVMFTAYLHDAFASSNRKYHHVEAATYVANASDVYLKMLSTEYIIMISDAILSHRASSNIDANTWLSNLLFIADKNEDTLEAIVIKAAKHKVYKIDSNKYKVTGDTHNHTFDYISLALGYISNTHDILLDIFSHIKDKYGRDGYLYNNRKMKRFVRVNIEKYNILWEQIDSLHVDDIRNIIKANV